MPGPSYPRRQQYRRLLHAGGGATAGVVAAVAAAVAWAAGATRLAGVLLLVVAGSLVYARHWARLAGRSRVGARSEGGVRRALSILRSEGWTLRHSVRWQGRGDIDSIAIAPTGTAFAIDVKTRTFDRGHLAAAREMAVWLERRRRKYCRRAALPVLCVVRAGALERIDDGVLIVSLDRLMTALRTAGGNGAAPRVPRPASRADDRRRPRAPGAV